MSDYDKYFLDDFFDLEDFLEEKLEEHDFARETREGDDENHLKHDEWDEFLFAEQERRTRPQPPAKDNFYTALMKIYVKDLESLVTNSKYKPSTYRVISGSGPAWFFEPTSRSFIKTERGSEVVIVPGSADEHGKVMVMVQDTYVMVPLDEITEIGYN